MPATANPDYPARNAATNTQPVAAGFAGNLWGATVGCDAILQF